MKRLICLLLAINIVLLMPAQSAFAAVKKPSWTLYYTDSLPYKKFENYDIVAFDSDSYPNFSKRNPNQIILGYLSTSEAESYRDYFKLIKSLNVTLTSNAVWTDHLMVDIRKPEWRQFFINTLVPQVINKGFNGIMLDTIDSAIYLEEQNPKKFKGMKAASLQFIIEIRQAHPGIKLMLNRGLPIAVQAAPYVDYILAESIRVEHDFKNNTNALLPPKVYAKDVNILKAAKKANPRLQVVTLDYWKMNKTNENKIRGIYKEQRANGFIPYVSTPDLMQLYPEPQ